MPQLIFQAEKDYPRIHDLATGKISIGRSGENDIVLGESSVSAFHAALTKKDGDSYLLEDLKSQNGTIVNGEPVEDAVLKDGDRIRFGSVKAVFLNRPESPASASRDDSLEKLQKEADGLMRKSNIERNNLKLIESDTRRVRAELEKKLKLKEELDGALDRLSKEVESAQTDLGEKRRASGELDGLIAEARDFEKKSKELEIEFNRRKNACEELDRKILAGEKLYGELDLENSIKQKEDLGKDLERLSREIANSRVELEENQRASGEAASIFEKAKEVEAGIGELELKLKDRKSHCEELEKKIADRERTREELSQNIAEHNSELETLTRSIESRQREVKDLADTAEKNEERIRSAGEKLADIETRIRKVRDEFSQSREKTKALEKESLTLTRIVSEKSSVLQRLKKKINSRGTQDSSVPPFRVIDPEMNSLVHYFHHGAGAPDEGRLDPIGYHAFAACTRGSIHREADSVLSCDDPVLLLLTGEMGRDKELIDSITRLPDRKLLVCWREGQLKALAAKQGGADLAKILAGISGIVSADAGTAAILGELDLGIPHLNVPIPCPVEFADWDLSVPASERTRGLYVSGFGFDPDSPLHRARLELITQLVSTTKTTVTVSPADTGVLGKLEIPPELLTRRETPAKYSEYLRLLGEHYLVTGFGKNFAGGDVTGDAVLARALFLGVDRDHATDALLFPDSCITGDTIEGALESAGRLLSDQDAYHETMERSQDMANQLISFESVRNLLNEFLHSISSLPY